MGVIAYQLLNPLRDNKIMAPFPGSFQSVFCVGNQVNSEMYKNKVSKVQPFDESVPKDLATVIGQMLEIDPQKRLSWVQLYEGGVLSQYDKEFRLATFMAEYKQL
jgi:serine/threonine protein kinase